jgi:hypothetical protein
VIELTPEAGWYEFHTTNALTSIAYVQENGDIFIPDPEFTMEDATRFYRLVREPRTIETEEDLDSLPVGSVVLSKEYQVLGDGGFWPVSFQRWDDRTWHRGNRSGDTHPDNFLPVTVIHEPS